MNILFANNYAGFVGGAESAVRQAALSFQERGHRCGLLYQEAARNFETYAEAFDQTWEIRDGIPDAAWAWAPDSIFIHNLTDLKTLEEAVACDTRVVRMVHDHNMYCQRSSRYFPWNRKICTKKAGYSCFLTCGIIRDRQAKIQIRPAWPGKKLKETEICKQLDHLITASAFLEEELVLHGFDPEKITNNPVVPQGAMNVKEKTDYSENLILWAGQIIRGKGVDFFLRSLNEIRDQNWKCIIAGEGSHMNACLKVRRELDLEDRVDFVGHVDQATLADYFQRARLAVISSVWPEPLPLVGIEYMWAAMPVVAFKVGGIPTWLKHGENGLLCESQDIEGMAEHITTLLENEDLARDMGQASIRKARNEYQYWNYIDGLIDLLNNSDQETRHSMKEPQLQTSSIP